MCRVSETGLATKQAEEGALVPRRNPVEPVEERVTEVGKQFEQGDAGIRGVVIGPGRRRARQPLPHPIDQALVVAIIDDRRRRLSAINAISGQHDDSRALSTRRGDRPTTPRVMLAMAPPTESHDLLGVFHPVDAFDENERPER